MKHTLFLTMLVAVFLGSGGASAKTYLASEYTDEKTINLGGSTSGTLVVDTPLTLKSTTRLNLWNGATIDFQKDKAAESICGIFTSVARTGKTVYFGDTDGVYNLAFDDGAQAIIAASSGTPITLIQDKNTTNDGFYFMNGASPSNTTLQLNGVGYNQTVELGGVSFTYVGPKESDYVFQAGEIGFTGYENGSHALNLVAKAAPTPEPTTGSLSLLALAGLCARRRKK